MGKAWAVLVVLAGCGPVDFEGRYVGSVTRDTACTDNSDSSSTRAATWLLRDQGGGVLLITTNGGPFDCGALKGLVKGRAVELQAKDCESWVSDDDVLISDTIRTGGRLTLGGEKLRVDFKVFSTLRYPNQSQAGCDHIISGLLDRVE